MTESRAEQSRVQLQQLQQVSKLFRSSHQKVSFLGLEKWLGRQMLDSQVESAVLFCWWLVKRLCQSSLRLSLVHCGSTGS